MACPPALGISWALALLPNLESSQPAPPARRGKGTAHGAPAVGQRGASLPANCEGGPTTYPFHR